jgi:hypothetical protein
MVSPGDLHWLRVQREGERSVAAGVKGMLAFGDGASPPGPQDISPGNE